ncbi:hypothetical protein pipiens_017112 [Culex pipiens pipiens]|uniref:Uncharacterized protein n=1 Tax=Culex pipiens pipiens TaxID=38569 RepID=A0ABD1CI33_CULPP
MWKSKRRLLLLNTGPEQNTRYILAVSESASAAKDTLNQLGSIPWKINSERGRVLDQKAQAGSTAAVGRNCDGLRNNGSLCRLQSMLSSKLAALPVCSVIVVHSQSHQSCRCSNASL